MTQYLQNIPIYWINLTNRADRRKNMIEYFKKYNIHYNIRITPNTHDIPWISCIKSHFDAIHTAYQDNSELAIFAEDDINLDSLSINIFDIITKLPADWECFQIHYIEPSLLQSVKIYQPDQNYIIKGYFMSCAFYIFNKKGMYNFLNKLGKYDINKKKYTSIFKITQDARAEELVFRYVNSYTTLYPIINTIENYNSDINSLSHQLNYNNMININDIYSIPSVYNKINNFSNTILEIPYNLHWFSDTNTSNSFLQTITKNRIITFLHSGLGNRLFQFASMYGLSKDKNFNFEIIHKKNNQHISKYSGYINIFFEKFTKDFKIYDNEEKIKDIHNMIINPKYFNQPYLSEYEFIDFEHFFTNHNFVYIFNGFFQNHKYFHKYDQEIKEIIKEPQFIKDTLDTLNIDFNNTIAIHVRLTDYINEFHKEKHFIDLNSYYKKSIEYTKNIQNFNYIIVSEDSEEICKQFYPHLKNFDKLISNDELLDLFFMSRCKGVICSNSTFSWWGSYLGRNDKYITIPNKWLNDREGCVNMIDSQIKIIEI